MAFTGVEAVLLDYGDTLVSGPPPGADREALIERVRVGVLPFLSDVYEPTTLVIRGHEALQEVFSSIQTADDSARGTLAAVDPMEHFRQALEKRKVWLPEGLLEEALGLDTGVVTEVVFRKSPLKAETRQVLRDLRRRGYLLGVVYNTELRRDWLQGVPALAPDDDIVDAVILSSEVGYTKPHPAIFRAAWEALGVHPGATLFVGDSLAEDIRGAKGAGVPSATLTHEHRQETDDQGQADAVLGCLADLLELL